MSNNMESKCVSVERSLVGTKTRLVRGRRPDDSR